MRISQIGLNKYFMKHVFIYNLERRPKLFEVSKSTKKSFLKDSLAKNKRIVLRGKKMTLSFNVKKKGFRSFGSFTGSFTALS